MLEFTAEEVYDIKGRGRVYSVRNPMAFKKSDCPYVGKEALINGRKYTILGVETFAIENIREGSPIGLLVKDMDAQ